MHDEIAMPSRRDRTVSLARLWHGGVAAIIATALMTQLILVITADAADLAFRIVNFLSFFTVQSNILLCSVSLLLARQPRRDTGQVWLVARLDSLICMTVTGLVYITVLRGLVELTGPAILTDAAFHYFAPLAAVVGWLLFGPRPLMRPRIVGLALLFPIAWCVYTLVRGELVGWYPYPFIDVGELGYRTVAVNIVGVAALIAAVGVAYLLADRRLRPAPARPVVPRVESHG